MQKKGINRSLEEHLKHFIFFSTGDLQRFEFLCQASAVS